MALNDDAVADLPTDTLVDEDIVKSSSVTKPTDQNTIIVPKTSDIKQEATPLTEDQVQSMVDTNISFKLINDNASKIVDLKDIEQEFIAQESIDRNAAQYLDQYFPGLISSRLTLEEFTRTPSKTHFKNVGQHIKLFISQEEANVIVGFSEFTNNTLKDTKEILEKLKEDYLQEFQINMRAMAKLSEKVIADVAQSKNTIVPFQNGEHVEFLDVAALDLLSLDFGNLKLKPESISLLTLYKNNIESIITNSNVKTLIVLVTDCGCVSYPVDKEILVHVSDKPINLLVLAKFFNGKALEDYLDTFDATIVNLLTTIETIQTEASELQQTYPDVKAYLVAKSTLVHESINTALQLVTTVNNLNMLGQNVRELFLYLSTLASPK